MCLDAARNTEVVAPILICERQNSGLETRRWIGRVGRRRRHDARHRQSKRAERQTERGRRAEDDRIQREAATRDVARWNAGRIAGGIDGTVSAAMRAVMGRCQLMMVVRSNRMPVLAGDRTGLGHHHRWHLQQADRGHEPGQGQA